MPDYWLLDSNVKETFPGTLKGSILLDSIFRLTENATEHVTFFVDLSRFFLCDFCCHGFGQPGGKVRDEFENREGRDTFHG